MAAPKRIKSPACWPKYNDIEEINEVIEEYFKSCEGHVATDDEGQVLYNKYGEPIVIDRHPPTTAGLAYALGFRSRSDLHLYRTKPANRKFWGILDRAFLKIEMYAEERLYDRDGVNGSKFVLSNGFEGWNAAAERKAEAGAPTVTVVNDIPRRPKEDVIGPDE